MDITNNEASQEGSAFYKSRELELRELFLEKNNLENQIKRAKEIKQGLIDRVKERTNDLESTPSPTKMRVWAIVVLGIVLFHVSCFFVGETDSAFATGALVALIDFPLYMVMVGLLAKASKRSAALTWFNVLTLGIFGVILALVTFIRSFLVKPELIQNEIDNIKKEVVAVECDIDAQNRRMIHIEAQISYLTGRF